MGCIYGGFRDVIGYVVYNGFQLLLKGSNEFNIVVVPTSH